MLRRTRISSWKSIVELSFLVGLESSLDDLARSPVRNQFPKLGVSGGH
jgi:hypothetical protein